MRITYSQCTIQQLIGELQYYARHISVHVRFHKPFIQNKFGYTFKICDRLWFEGNLKNLICDSVEFVRTFIQNVDKHFIAVCSTCRTSIEKSIPKMVVYNGFEYPTMPGNFRNCSLDLVSERLISPRIFLCKYGDLVKLMANAKYLDKLFTFPWKSIR